MSHMWTSLVSRVRSHNNTSRPTYKLFLDYSFVGRTYVCTYSPYFGTARSVEDETRNGDRNANRNSNRNHETIVLGLFSLLNI